MIPAPVERSYAVLSKIAASRTAEEIPDHIIEWAGSFGFEQVLAGVIPPMNAAPTTQAGHVLLGRWPTEWGHTYFRKGLIARDPTIKRVLRLCPAFTWRTIATDGSEDIRVMHEAREHGLAEGVTVPLVTLAGRAAGISFAGRKVEDSPETIGCLSLVAAFAIGRALELKREGASGPVRLTQRESEVLAWTADGKTDWEISVILGISEQAVRKHAARSRCKLGAVNRAHAVAEAMRRNLIR